MTFISFLFLTWPIFCCYMTCFQPSSTRVHNPSTPQLTHCRWMDIVHETHSSQRISLEKTLDHQTSCWCAIWFSWCDVELSVLGTESTFWWFSYTLALPRTKAEHDSNHSVRRVTLDSVLQVKLLLTKKQETFPHLYCNTGVSFFNVNFHPASDNNLLQLQNTKNIFRECD